MFEERPAPNPNPELYVWRTEDGKITVCTVDSREWDWLVETHRFTDADCISIDSRQARALIRDLQLALGTTPTEAC